MAQARKPKLTGRLAQKLGRATNSCCMLGEAQDSYVVDVANNTLGQDELKYMTGSGRSYTAVLTADKENDLSTGHGRGTEEGLRDHQLIKHVNLITINVESTTRVRQRQDLAMFEE